MFALRRSTRMLGLRSVSSLGRAALPQTLDKATAPSHSAPFKLIQRNMSLEKILKAEIKFEEKEENQEFSDEYLEAKAQYQKDWKFTNEKGSPIVKLIRKYKNETITVSYNVQHVSHEELPADEEEGQEEEEPNSISSINFSLTVDNGKTKLVFDAIGGEQGLAIRDIAHRALDQADDANQYSGANFHQLDEKLQEEFMAYLNERGITDEFGGFILTYAEEVENKLYVNWLKEVHSFVSAPAK